MKNTKILFALLFGTAVVVAPAHAQVVDVITDPIGGVQPTPQYQDQKRIMRFTMAQNGWLKEIGAGAQDAGFTYDVYKNGILAATDTTTASVSGAYNWKALSSAIQFQTGDIFDVVYNTPGHRFAVTNNVTGPTPWLSSHGIAFNIPLATPYSSTLYSTSPNFSGYAQANLRVSSTNSSAVPEPGEWAAMGVLGAGLAGLVLRKRRAK